MDGLPIAMLLLFTAGVYCSETDTEDKVQLEVSPPGIIKQGGTFTITCSVKDLDMFDVFRIIRMTKDKFDQNKAVPIMVNGNLDEKFANHPGPQVYRVDEKDFKKGIFKLTIENIQGEDGGDLGCEHRSKINGDDVSLTAMEVFTVYVPVNSVQIRQRIAGDDVFTPIADGETAVMREGFDDEVQCFVDVKGSDPDIKPTIEFKFGDHDMRKDNNIEHDTDQENPLDDDLKFRVPYYKAEYRYKTATPDKAYNQKIITCAATMPNYEIVTTTAVLDVQYPPSVNCRSVYYTKIGEEFQMTCKAEMNPAPTESFWTWGSGDDATQLNTGDVLNGYEATQIDGDEPGKYVFSLTFSTMNTTYLGSYSFSLKNSLAEEIIKKEIKLEEAEVTTTTPAPTSPPKSKETKKPNTDESKSDPSDNEIPDPEQSSDGSRVHSSIVMSLLCLFCALLASRS